MKKRLAIVNCKSKKQSYECTAEEMYSISFQFRSQIDFIKKYYDDYVILSTKYGIIYPTSIIKPYEVSLARGARLKNTHTLLNTELNEWANNVKKQLQSLSETYDIIDLHISNQYLKPIKDILNNPKFTHIKQPVNPGLVRNRYKEILNSFNQGEKINLASIGEKRKSENPEIEKWWYHPELGQFYGFARHLVKKFSNVDEGNANRVSRGLNSHTCGWVVNKNFLQKLYKTKTNKWRIKE